jgi:hypothetical protein
MPYSQITSVPAPETTTALAIRGQLAEAQERLVKAEKRWNNGHAGDGPCLGGLGAAFAAFVALGISGSPVCLVVLAGGFMSAGIGVGIQILDGERLKRAKARVAAFAGLAALETSAKPVALISGPSPHEESVRQKVLTTAAAKAEIARDPQNHLSHISGFIAGFRFVCGNWNRCTILPVPKRSEKKLPCTPV